MPVAAAGVDDYQVQWQVSSAATAKLEAALAMRPWSLSLLDSFGAKSRLIGPRHKPLHSKETFSGLQQGLRLLQSRLVTGKRFSHR